jgi:hypothetical protein
MIVIFRLCAHVPAGDMKGGADITCQSSRGRSCRSCASRLHVLSPVAVSSITHQLTFPFTAHSK